MQLWGKFRKGQFETQLIGFSRIYFVLFIFSYATISGFGMKRFLKIASTLSLSANSAIVKCVEIWENYRAFRATAILIF
jgi:hypothetical protein